MTISNIIDEIIEKVVNQGINKEVLLDACKHEPDYWVNIWSALKIEQERFICKTAASLLTNTAIKEEEKTALKHIETAIKDIKVYYLT